MAEQKQDSGDFELQPTEDSGEHSPPGDTDARTQKTPKTDPRWAENSRIWKAAKAVPAALPAGMLPPAPVLNLPSFANQSPAPGPAAAGSQTAKAPEVKGLEELTPEKPQADEAAHDYSGVGREIGGALGWFGGPMGSAIGSVAGGLLGKAASGKEVTSGDLAKAGIGLASGAVGGVAGRALGSLTALFEEPPAGGSGGGIVDTGSAGAPSSSSFDMTTDPNVIFKQMRGLLQQIARNTATTASHGSERM